MEIGVVRAKYNEAITHKMLESAREKAKELGAGVEVVEVPGAYDTPLSADRLARKESIDAVVVLGAIIKGDTDHDRIIGDSVAHRLSQISLDRDKPVMMGITGPGMTAEEAKDRIDYAAQALESAFEMVQELQEV